MSAEKNAGRVVDLRARLERVPMPEDGPPAITFGWDEGAPVTFRDMATLDAFTQEAIAEALLEAADDVREWRQVRWHYFRLRRRIAAAGGPDA